ncbi:MAG: hypothetical protein GXO23_06480 [Crenarchaeota archaeon]|nr:hypothetical protein [Thermoproteota archaeon]
MGRRKIGKSRGVSGALSIIILLQLTLLLIMLSYVMIEYSKMSYVKYGKDEAHLTEILMIHRIDSTYPYFTVTGYFLIYATETKVLYFPVLTPALFKGVYYIACGDTNYVAAYYPSVPVAWG